MEELRIKIPEGRMNKTLMVITNHFDVGIKKVGDIITVSGNESIIEEIKIILETKIINPSKTSSEWIYPLSDPEHPQSCSPD
jgi:hypothetical protein